MLLLRSGRRHPVPLPDRLSGDHLAARGRRRPLRAAAARAWPSRRRRAACCGSSCATFGGVPVLGAQGEGARRARAAARPAALLPPGRGRSSTRLYELLFNDVAPGRSSARRARTGARRPSWPRTRSGRSASSATRGSCRRRPLLPGYRLLQEYFAFPEKFLFFDLDGPRAAMRAGFGRTLELLFFLDREFPLERSVNAQTFRLDCDAVVNLFEQMAEPIRLTQLQSEYRVVPDVGRPDAHRGLLGRRRDERPARTGDARRPTSRSTRSSTRGDARRPQAFWHASRRPSERKDDEGTEVYLTLVDLDFNPSSATPRPSSCTRPARTATCRAASRSATPRATSSSRAPASSPAIRVSAQADAERPPAAAPRGAVAPDLAPLAELPVAGRARGGGARGAPGDPEALRLRRLAVDAPADRGISRLATRRVAPAASAPRIRGLRPRPRGHASTSTSSSSSAAGVFLFASRARAVPRALRVDQLLLPARGVDAAARGRR